MLYERILKELQEKKIRYLVVGGFAVNFYGYDRVTADLDIVLLMTDDNLRKFIKVAEKFKLKPGIPVELKDLLDSKKRKQWIKEKNMVAFPLYNPDNQAEHIDVLINSPVDFEKAYTKKEIVEAGGIDIFLISIEDLIKMKSKAGRQRDKIDKKALTFIKGLNNDKKKKS